MKIGIVTITDHTNCGNRLQNYALCHLLQARFGCTVTSLVPREEKPFENGDPILWLKTRIARKLCVFPAFAEKRFGPNMTRWANFSSWNRHIPTRSFYQCRRLPASLNREFDFFFAGSDQIWNYHFASAGFENYFLSFAEDCKKAAICGSFGVEEIPEEWRQRYTDGLSGFSHISVREDAGQRIIKALIGRQVPILIDPTMMLSPEEWIRVSKKPRVDCSKPYILKYFLGEETENNIEKWAAENGFEVYELLNEKIPALYSAGPGEFLSLIRNASLVCSDSFHCIAFSILFSRPFVVCTRQGSENDMTSRLTTLLNKFRFRHRWHHLLSPEEYLECGFAHVPPLLKAEQQKFMEYIRSILQSR